MKDLADLPTREVRLPAKFLDRLQEVAPKKKRSKLWIVLLLALAGGGAWLGLTVRGRAIVAQARQKLSRPTTSISIQAPIATDSATAPVAASASSQPIPVAATVSAVASASPPATASEAPSASASTSAKPATKHRKHH